jgi:dCTP deaminase
MFTRSSFARRGILGSFGFVDAGFRGQLTLSFYNSSSDPLKLKAGDRIAQIVFHRIDQPVERNYEQRSGNYQNSSGITVGGTASVKRD